MYNMHCDWSILGADFPVIPTGTMSDVNALLVKQEYRKCESTFDSNISND